jgi:MFS family permease
LSLRKHRWLLLSVYIPTVMFSFGQGLLVPILPLYAAEYGGSYSLAGFVVAAGWIGTMIGAKRVAVSRAFSHLKEAGAVEFKRRYIYITDMEVLREASTAG